MVRAPAPAASPSAIPRADWGTVTVKRGDPIKVSFAAPLSGENAGLGVDEQRGVELAIEETPQVKGFPIRLVPEDDGCAADRAAAVAQKVAADPQVVGVVGHLCSSASLAASAVYEPAHIVMISPSSTAPALTSRGLAVVNRVVWNDEVQAIEAARFARNTLRAGTAAALHDGSAFGIALAGAFREEFGRLGGRLGGFEGITPGEKDFRPTLARLAAGRPEVVYFAGSAPEAALLAAQLPDVGLRGVRLIGSDLIYTPAYLQQAGSAPTETYATYAEAATSQPTPRRNDFDRRYEARYRARPSDAGSFHYHAYDAAALLIAKIDQVAAVNAAGDLTIDRNALARAVRTTANFAGLTGAITCQPTGDCGTARVVVNVARNGRWEPATP